MKKAESQYLSWIIIFAMVMSLSYLLYNWSIAQAKKTGEVIETKGDETICYEVGIRIENLCQKENLIIMNITNNNLVDISGISVRFIGLYPNEKDYVITKIFDKKIPSMSSEKVNLIKRKTITQIYITPIIEKENKQIYCEQKAISAYLNEQCKLY